METPFFGGSYTSLSPNLADSLCMNLYPELVETKEGKQIGAFYSTPGQRFLQTLANSGAGYVSGPMRGIHAAANHMLVAVFGNQVVQIDQNQNVTPLGHLNTASGPVSIIDNGSQYAVFDYFQGWSWSGSAWAQITTIPSFPGTATQQDGFGVVGINGTNQFYQSNLYDLTTWNALNFSSADSDSSNLVAVTSLYRQLWLFKEKSIEIWNNAGLSGFVFQRMDGAYVNVGCAAPASVAISEDNVFWLGQSDKGSLVVYRNNGYAEARISTHAVEYAMQGYLGLSSIGVADAIGFCYTQAGHTFYVLTFPAANATHVYDATTKLWSQRGEWINGSYQRWDPSCYAYFAKRHIVGSSTGQQLSTLDLLYPLDDLPTTPPVNAKRWARRWRALPKPINNPVRLQSLRIDMQAGMPTDYPGQGAYNVPTTPILTIYGHLPNGIVGTPANFSYTIVSSFTVKTVTVTSGALPTGLSINNQGVVTGSPTTQGSFSWTLTVTDVLGNTANLNDSCTVILMLAGAWIATNNADTSQIWTSNDPASWASSPLSLSSSTTLGTQSGPEWDGSAFAMAGTTSNNALVVANQQQLTPLTSSVVNSLVNGYRIKAAGGILFRYGQTSPTFAYSYSTDHGLTWNSVTLAGGLAMRGIARLNSGRWVAQLTQGPTQTFQYSDQAIPTTWTPATGPFSASFIDILECDGITALSPNNSNALWKTTDGATWSAVSGGFPGTLGVNTVIGRCIGVGSFLFPGSVNTGTFYVTHDSGTTWTLHSRVGGGSGGLVGISAHGSTVAICWNGAMGIDVSHDGGDTWAAATLPWSSPSTKSPLCGFLG